MYYAAIMLIKLPFGILLCSKSSQIHLMDPMVIIRDSVNQIFSLCMLVAVENEAETKDLFQYI